MAVLLHLSDIHFRKRSGDPLDLDEDLRNELLIDAADVCNGHLGVPDAILVGGDIAYSGKAEEYVHAKTFLEDLAEKVKATLACLWGVPGNHDVDQAYIRQSPILLDIQNTIRTAGPAGIDKKLWDYLGDPLGKAQLFQSIQGFNDFARTFGFHFDASRTHHHVDLTLNDTSLLRIHGLNSTITSNHLDNGVQEIVLGRYQLPKRQTGITNVVLCHHPPDWWADDDEVDRDMNHRAHLQLYGHKHNQVMLPIGNSLRLVAGAVHPSRDEQKWRPRYNWLKVEVEGTADSRKLAVTVYPRVWSEAAPKFIGDFNLCDGKESKTYVFDLDPWRPEHSIPSSMSGSAPVVTTSGATEPVTMNSPMRLLTYRLLDLPYPIRVAIAQKLGLIRNDDAGLNDYEVFRRVLRRATDEDRLFELWSEAQAAHADGKFPDNPFKK